MRGDLDPAGGLRLPDVGHVDGVPAAVVDPQRAVAVGVGRVHLAAQFGDGETPVDRHRDLVNGEARPARCSAKIRAAA